MSQDQNFPCLLRRIHHALHDLRSGFHVIVEGADGEALLVMAAEFLVELSALPFSNQGWQLVLTAHRAERIGLGVAGPVRLPLAALPLPEIRAFINPAQERRTSSRSSRDVSAAGKLEAQALSLIKYADLLPAAILLTLPADDNWRTWAAEGQVLSVCSGDIAQYKQALAETLMPVSEARVPLKNAEPARVIAFRPRYGLGQHLAIVIGEPKEGKVPLVRLHSSCVTGDVLGSLRCDCGDQLQSAIAAIAKDGYGALIYLEQEGRGIGIVNKLRAYQLQDDGLDTVDANLEMGFDSDERHFQPAAIMLRHLGMGKVRLLTNNPQKIEELRRYGIDVAERVPLIITPGEHNRAYLETKAKKAGHLL